MFAQKSHYSPRTDVASDVNVPAQGLFLREAELTGLSCCLAAPGAGFWDSCLRVELSELLQQKRELVLKQKGPCLRAAVQGKSPFFFSKAVHTLCSEKRYTSVGRTQEAGWQDAGYRNKLTQSLHLAAVLISSQAALTTYECLFGVFKVILNYLQGMSLPKSTADREKGWSYRS